MEFSVEFCGSCGYAISNSSRTIGISQVDTIRRGINLPELSIDLIQSEVPSFFDSYEINVKESVARESGRFAEKTRVLVVVKRGALNKYLSLEYAISRDENTGEIKSISSFYHISPKGCDELVADWVAAGYPLEWGTNSTDESSSSVFG